MKLTAKISTKYWKDRVIQTFNTRAFFVCSHVPYHLSYLCVL